MNKNLLLLNFNNLHEISKLARDSDSTNRTILTPDAGTSSRFSKSFTAHPAVPAFAYRTRIARSFFVCSTRARSYLTSRSINCARHSIIQKIEQHPPTHNRSRRQRAAALTRGHPRATGVGIRLAVMQRCIRRPDDGGTDPMSWCSGHSGAPARPD